MRILLAACDFVLSGVLIFCAAAFCYEFATGDIAFSFCFLLPAIILAYIDYKLYKLLTRKVIEGKW